MSCPLVRQRNPFIYFPFLSGRRTGEAAYKEYNRTLSRFNRDLEVVGEIDRRYASGHLIYDPSFIRLVLEGTRCIDRGYQ